MQPWLNYHHFYYFWRIASAGSIVRAASQLRLAQPTLSAQLKQLEDSLGEQLFHREGKRLVLSEFGALAYRYAEEIFSLGAEFQKTLQSPGSHPYMRFRVGVVDSIPKMITYKILQPVFSRSREIHLHCQEGSHTDLLADLAKHDLDLVISDSPVTSEIAVQAYNHPLEKSPLSIFANAKMARRFRAKFPQSLSDAPLILPPRPSNLRRIFDQWCESHDLLVEVVCETQDSALSKVFARGGHGLTVLPEVIAEEARKQYGLHRVGTLEEIEEEYIAISLERKIKHPAVALVTQHSNKSG